MTDTVQTVLAYLVAATVGAALVVMAIRNRRKSYRSRTDDLDQTPLKMSPLETNRKDVDAPTRSQ